MKPLDRWLSLAMVVVAAGYHWGRHNESETVFFLLLAIWLNTQSGRAA